MNLVEAALGNTDQTKSNVAKTHPSYDEKIDQWTRCRDCVAGEDAIKAAGTAYLPMLDSHHEKPTKYDEYKQRAMFYGAVGRTVAGLSGAIFQKAPAVDTKNKVIKDEHSKDITLTDMPLDMFALHVTQEYLTTGRQGILVDMSGEESTNPRPYWVSYRAEDIINWKFKKFGGDQELSLVVLSQYVENESSEDEFDTEPVHELRVLRLEGEGNALQYTSQIYRQQKQGGKTIYVEGPKIVPKRAGKPLQFIPFALPMVMRMPPLLDLVSINLSHYRGNADLKHGLHMTALPTPWVAGLADNNKELYMGSGKAWALEKEGRAGMLEFTGQGIGAIRDDLKDMQAQMATLGARLLQEPPRYAETALSVAMRHSSDYATLRMVAQVVEQELTYALQIHEWWLSTGDTPVTEMESKIELNKVFYDQSLTADELRALLLALQGGAISYKTFYNRLTATGWTREGITEDEEKEDIKKDGDEFRPPEENPKPTGPEGQTASDHKPPIKAVM